MKWRVNIVNPVHRTIFPFEKNMIDQIASGELVIGLPHETKSMFKDGYTEEDLVLKGLVGVYVSKE